MHTTLTKIGLAGVIAAVFCGPVQAIACGGISCARLAGPEERIARVSRLAGRQGDILIAAAVCEAVSGSQRINCKDLEGLAADTKRAAAYADLVKDLTPTQRVAFIRLLSAVDAYASAVGENETDHLSAEAGGDAVAAQRAEKAAFLNTLKTVVGGTTRLSFIEFPESDSALNATYAQVMAVKDTSNLAWGSIDTAGIRRTQRAWLAYRDAFVTFAAMLDADVAGVLKAELTTRRTVGLEGFLED